MSRPAVSGVVLSAVSITTLLVVVVLLNRVYIVVRREAQVEEQPDTDAE